MSVLTVILISSIVLIFTGMIVLGIYFFGRLTSARLPPNSQLVHIFGTGNTRGHSLGVIKGFKKVLSGDSLLIEFRPLDVPYDRRGRPESCKDVQFAVRPELITEIPAGGNSLYRSEIYVAPSSPTDLSPIFRNTTLGASLAFGIAQLNLTDKAVSMIKNQKGSERETLALLEKEEHELITRFKTEIETLSKEKMRERTEPFSHTEKKTT